MPALTLPKINFQFDAEFFQGKIVCLMQELPRVTSITKELKELYKLSSEKVMSKKRKLASNQQKLMSTE